MSGFTGFSSLGNSRHSVGAMVGAAMGAAARMVRVAMSRRYLVEMDDHMLHDLGISRAQANFEASRAPWHTKPLRG